MTGGIRRGIVGVAVALALAAPPAGADASFDGTCSAQGSVDFAPPANNTTQRLDVRFAGTGTCSGTLNGRQVQDAPIEISHAGQAEGGCMQAHTIAPWAGRMTFADGTTIPYRLEFEFIGTEGTATLRADGGGTARGRGTFLTQRTPPDIALQCAGSGAAHAPLDLAFATESPLATEQPQPASPSPSPAAGLRLTVTPGDARVGRATPFRLKLTTAAGRPVRRAAVGFAGQRTRTSRRGGARIVATLDRAGEWTARARKRGRLVSATVLVRAPAESGQGPAPNERASRFAGDCQLNGQVAFEPPLTNSPGSVLQRARAQGVCDGTFVDSRGREHELNAAPVTYIASSQSGSASCSGGPAEGGGALLFAYGRVWFTLSEVRTGSLAVAHAAGAASGSADGIAMVSPSEDPAAILQKCGAAGLDAVAIDVHLTSNGIEG